MHVSTVIITLNEEINIGRCLESLSWCDDIVVVDSNSTDRTAEICAEHGVPVLQSPFVNYATQHNYALENHAFKHDWVLHLDADEIATPVFREALAALEPPPGIFGFRVPSRTILFGQWIKRAGMYPTYQVRLGHRVKCKYYEIGHGQRETLRPDEIGLFDVPYDHHTFSHGLVRWFGKHIKYAQAEAEEILNPITLAPDLLSDTNSNAMFRRRAMKRIVNRMPPVLRPIARFFYLSVIKRGILDGRAGLCYCIMMSIYEAMITVFVMQGRIGRPA